MPHTSQLVSRQELESHPVVERLLGNKNWVGAANCAIDFLIDGTPCPVPSWTRSSTWAQVKMAYDQLLRSKRPQ
jgi:hypothetical protein